MWREDIFKPTIGNETLHHDSNHNGVVVFDAKNLKINIYRTIILPVVLHACETWSLTLREELG